MRPIDADYFDKMLIDAQAKCAGLNNTFKYGFLATVRANLERCPSLDVEPVKRGRWIDMGDATVVCSECNNQIIGDLDYDFCPNCGARMMEERP